MMHVFVFSPLGQPLRWSAVRRGRTDRVGLLSLPSASCLLLVGRPPRADGSGWAIVAAFGQLSFAGRLSAGGGQIEFGPLSVQFPVIKNCRMLS